MHITDASDLSGLPEGAKEAAQQLAESKDKMTPFVGDGQLRAICSHVTAKLKGI